MRTSLNNIKTIDDYLLGRMAPDDSLLFEANMLLNSDLSDDVKYQQSTYSIIREYSRQNIKTEIKVVQEILATAPEHVGFMRSILNLFKMY
jgi:bacterioferritin (cytochrome b1)